VKEGPVVAKHPLTSVALGKIRTQSEGGAVLQSKDKTIVSPLPLRLRSGQALGLSELRVVGEEETDREIMVEVEYRRQVAMCPRCGQMTAKVHSTSAQTKRDRRLWDKPVYLILRKRRFCCLGCGKVFTEPDAVCGARQRTSERFRHQVGQEAIDQPARHLARREG